MWMLLQCNLSWLRCVACLYIVRISRNGLESLVVVPPPPSSWSLHFIAWHMYDISFLRVLKQFYLSSLLPCCDTVYIPRNIGSYNLTVCPQDVIDRIKTWQWPDECSLCISIDSDFIWWLWSLTANTSSLTLRHLWLYSIVYRMNHLILYTIVLFHVKLVFWDRLIVYVCMYVCNSDQLVCMMYIMQSISWHC